MVSEIIMTGCLYRFNFGLPLGVPVSGAISVTTDQDAILGRCFGPHCFFILVTTCSALLHVQSLMCALFPMIPIRGPADFIHADDVSMYTNSF